MLWASIRHMLDFIVFILMCQFHLKLGKQLILAWANKVLLLLAGWCEDFHLVLVSCVIHIYKLRLRICKKRKSFGAFIIILSIFSVSDKHKVVLSKRFYFTKFKIKCSFFLACYKIVKQFRSPPTAVLKTLKLLQYVFLRLFTSQLFLDIFPQMLYLHTWASTDRQIKVEIAVVNWEDKWSCGLCGWWSVTENVLAKAVGPEYVFTCTPAKFCRSYPFNRLSMSM